MNDYEVTAHAQSDSVEDAREICADGTYFPNNLRKWNWSFTATANCQSVEVLVLLEYKVVITFQQNFQQKNRPKCAG